MFNKKRIWWIFIAAWLAVTVVISMIAPGAKEFAQTNKNAGLPDDAAAIIAEQKLEEHFPKDGGLPLFSVLHKADGLTEAEIIEFTKALSSIETMTDYGEIAMPPIADIDVNHLNAFLAEDNKTFFIPLTLPEDMESKDLHELMETIDRKSVV